MAVWIHLSQDNIGLDDAKQRGVVDRQGENEGGRFGMVSRIIPIDRWVFTGMITRLKFHRSRENISSSEGKNGTRDFERGERGFNSVIMHEKYILSRRSCSLLLLNRTHPPRLFGG